MSITASFVVFVVLVVRLLLKKTPKIFSYALWAVVLFRLICPFSFESAVGILPINGTPISQDIVYSLKPQINTGLNILDDIVNPILPIPKVTEDSVNPLQIWVFVGSVIWAIGILSMFIYSIIQFGRLKRKLIGATPLRDNIYLADHINSPFVMGFVNPKIYLPSSMAETEQDFIMAHEKYHIKRFDHIARILSFMALTIHWFNPLVWLAFVLSGKDMEMSCDEAVMKKMDKDIRAQYSQSLLRFATGKKLIVATPLAFGEGATKDRVKNVMRYKKPTFWVSIIAVFVVIAIAVGLMSNSKTEPVPKEAGSVSVKSLWKNRTEYVGNNVAVGNILYELSFPDNMQYKNFELKTKEQPYEIIVHFDGVNNALKSVDHGNGQTETVLNIDFAQLEQNARIMFSLIGNVEKITFSVNRKEGGTLANDYMRNNYDELFTKTVSYEEFQTVLTEILDDSNSNSLSNFKGVELYVWKNEIDETYFTLLSGTNRNKTEGEIYDKNVATTDISKIANTLLGFDDGLHLFIIQMNKTDFTKDEMTAYEQEIIAYIGDNIKDYSISIGLFKPAGKKDISTSNAQYKTEADFLNSPDGVKFQAVAYKAAKAYLNGDKDELATCISENCIVDVELDLFKDIDYMILKWSLDDIKAEDKINAAYEFKIKGEDSVSFVSMELIKIDSEWKVDFIGIEK